MTFKAFNALRLFTEIAHHPSFSAAAQHLNMTKGAVSYQVTMLEQQLGFCVFHRQPRGITLTKPGEALLNHSTSTLRDLTNVINALANRSTDELTVGMSSYFAARWLSPRLMTFMQQHPQITLKLQPMIDLQDFLDEGIDMVIRWGNGHWPGVTVESLFSSPVRAYAGRHVAERVGSMGLQRVLQETPLLQDREGSKAWQLWHQSAGIHYTPHNGHLVIPDPSVRLQAVVDGQGIALYDDLAIAEQTAGTLVPVSSVQLDNFGYYLIYADGALDNPASQQFRQWILQLAQANGHQAN